MVDSEDKKENIDSEDNQVVTDDQGDKLSLKIVDLLERVPNRFLLAIAASKRSRQIQDGIKPLVPVPKEEESTPILTALKEIQTDKLKVVVKENVEEEKATLEELDQFFEKEAEEERLRKEEQEGDKKGKDKNKSSKSKSLAA